jgi:hypothetical protein
MPDPDARSRCQIQTHFFNVTLQGRWQAWNRLRGSWLARNRQQASGRESYWALGQVLAARVASMHSCALLLHHPRQGCLRLCIMRWSIRKPRLVLGLMPPALNRMSISPLLTAARREKLLISAADMRKCPICLRSTSPRMLHPPAAGPVLPRLWRLPPDIAVNSGSLHALPRLRGAYHATFCGARRTPACSRPI